MIIHMNRRTTLVLDESILRELKKIAADEQKTLSAVTYQVIRSGLAKRSQPKKTPARKLPAFSMGRPKVDVADRDRLYDVLDAPDAK